MDGLEVLLTELFKPPCKFPLTLLNFGMTLKPDLFGAHGQSQSHEVLVEK